MAEIDTRPRILLKTGAAGAARRSGPTARPARLIYEAARHEFAASGYAATSMESVVRSAGISTKTLYRLIPTKASLFEGMVSDRTRSLSVRGQPSCRRSHRYRRRHYVPR
jgi:AcrR family transcriptional regulator